jgi:hypothetical protein
VVKLLTLAALVLAVAVASGAKAPDPQGAIDAGRKAVTSVLHKGQGDENDRQDPDPGSEGAQDSEDGGSEP